MAEPKEKEPTDFQERRPGLHARVRSLGPLRHGSDNPRARLFAPDPQAIERALAFGLPWAWAAVGRGYLEAAAEQKRKGRRGPPPNARAVRCAASSEAARAEAAQWAEACTLASATGREPEACLAEVPCSPRALPPPGRASRVLYRLHRLGTLSLRGDPKLLLYARSLRVTIEANLRWSAAQPVILHLTYCWGAPEPLTRAWLDILWHLLNPPAETWVECLGLWRRVESRWAPCLAEAVEALPGRRDSLAAVMYYGAREILRRAHGGNPPREPRREGRAPGPARLCSDLVSWAAGRPEPHLDKRARALAPEARAAVARLLDLLTPNA